MFDTPLSFATYVMPSRLQRTRWLFPPIHEFTGMLKKFDGSPVSTGTMAMPISFVSASYHEQAIDFPSREICGHDDAVFVICVASPPAAGIRHTVRGPARLV